MLKSNKIIILIVLYNKKFRDSETINRLIEIRELLDDFLILIWDNSPYPDKKIEYLSSLNYKLIQTPENLSLSIIYNNCVHEYKHLFDYVWIFDDDSSIDFEMIDSFKDAILKNQNIKLFLPKVKVDDKLVSPGKFKFIKATYFSNDISGLIDSKGIIGIMSGSCISLDFFNHYSYQFDTDLKIYGIDTKFYLDFQKYEKQLYIVDYTMKHDLSFFTETDISKIIYKFNEHKVSLRKVIGSKSILHCIFLEIYLFYLTIKNVIQYKTIQFF